MAAGTSRASKNTSPGMNLKDHLSEQKRLLHTELDAVACEKENLGRLRLLLHRQCEKSSRFGTMDIDEIIDIPVTRKKSLAARKSNGPGQNARNRPTSSGASSALIGPTMAVRCHPLSPSEAWPLGLRQCVCGFKSAQLRVLAMHRHACKVWHRSLSDRCSKTTVDSLMCSVSNQKLSKRGSVRVLSLHRPKITKILGKSPIRSQSLKDPVHPETEHINSSRDTSMCPESSQSPDFTDSSCLSPPVESCRHTLSADIRDRAHCWVCVTEQQYSQYGFVWRCRWCGKILTYSPSASDLDLSQRRLGPDGHMVDPYRRPAEFGGARGRSLRVRLGRCGAGGGGFRVAGVSEETGEAEEENGGVVVATVLHDVHLRWERCGDPSFFLRSDYRKLHLSSIYRGDLNAEVEIAATVTGGDAATKGDSPMKPTASPVKLAAHLEKSTVSPAVSGVLSESTDHTQIDSSKSSTEHSTRMISSSASSTTSIKDSTASTEKLTASTKELSASTEEPTSSTKEPTASTEKLTASTKELSASTEEPTSSTKEPTASTEKLTASTKEPSASTEGPTTSTEELTVSTKEPPVVSHITNSLNESVSLAVYSTPSVTSTSSTSQPVVETPVVPQQTVTSSSIGGSNSIHAPDSASNSGLISDSMSSVTIVVTDPISSAPTAMRKSSGVTSEVTYGNLAASDLTVSVLSQDSPVPNAISTDSLKSGAVELDAAMHNTVKLDAARHNAVKLDAAGHNVVELDAAGQDAVRLDAVKLDEKTPQINVTTSSQLNSNIEDKSKSVCTDQPHSSRNSTTNNIGSKPSDDKSSPNAFGSLPIPPVPLQTESIFVGVDQLTEEQKVSLIGAYYPSVARASALRLLRSFGGHVVRLVEALHDVRFHRAQTDRDGQLDILKSDFLRPRLREKPPAVKVLSGQEAIAAEKASREGQSAPGLAVGGHVKAVRSVHSHHTRRSGLKRRFPDSLRRSGGRSNKMSRPVSPPPSPPPSPPRRRTRSPSESLSDAHMDMQRRSHAKKATHADISTISKRSTPRRAPARAPVTRGRALHVSRGARHIPFPIYKQTKEATDASREGKKRSPKKRRKVSADLQRISPRKACKRTHIRAEPESSLQGDALINSFINLRSNHESAAVGKQVSTAPKFAEISQKQLRMQLESQHFLQPPLMQSVQMQSPLMQPVQMQPPLMQPVQIQSPLMQPVQIQSPRMQLIPCNDLSPLKKSMQMQSPQMQSIHNLMQTQPQGIQRPQIFNQATALHQQQLQNQRRNFQQQQMLQQMQLRQQMQPQRYFQQQMQPQQLQMQPIQQYKFQQRQLSFEQQMQQNAQMQSVQQPALTPQDHAFRRQVQPELQATNPAQMQSQSTTGRKSGEDAARDKQSEGISVDDEFEQQLVQLQLIEAQKRQVKQNEQLRTQQQAFQPTAQRFGVLQPQLQYQQMQPGQMQYQQVQPGQIQHMQSRQMLMQVPYSRRPQQVQGPGSQPPPNTNQAENHTKRQIHNQMLAYKQLQAQNEAIRERRGTMHVHDIMMQQATQTMLQPANVPPDQIQLPANGSLQ
eukprot:166495_1